jgi:hypothetical protein
MIILFFLWKEEKHIFKIRFQKWNITNIISINDMKMGDFFFCNLYNFLPDMKIPVSSRDTRIEEFIKWMKENGAEIEGIKIAQFEGYGYGIKAEKNFSHGDLLIAVPRKLMLTTENVEDSLLGMFMVFCYCKHIFKQIMMIFYGYMLDNKLVVFESR